jgi:hypothetical protein
MDASAEGPTTIGSNNYAHLHKMVKARRAESLEGAADTAVEMVRGLPRALSQREGPS